MTAANVHDLHYLKDVQWEYHDRVILGDNGYLSAPIQQDLFSSANIILEVPYRLNKEVYTQTMPEKDSRKLYLSDNQQTKKE